MNEMIKRVVTKLKAAADAEPYMLHPDRPEALRWAFIARAAAEAMREPTDAMFEAGYEHVGVQGDAGDPAKVWAAMIDAALK
jgi:hypothetical protein